MNALPKRAELRSPLFRESRHRGDVDRFDYRRLVGKGRVIQPDNRRLSESLIRTPYPLRNSPV
jgi:hypothetical protein